MLTKSLPFFLVSCLKSALSKVLGIGIIIGSTLVKVPQVVKIAGSRSGEGISILSISLELAAITFNGAYSFMNAYPFSAWGEAAFLALQTVLIAGMVLHFGGSTQGALAYTGMYTLLLAMLVSGHTPSIVLWYLASSVIPLILGGKAIQAWQNVKQGHTGQLSGLTLFLLLAGSLARIFTSVQETGDPVIVVSYLASSTVNAVILAQIIWYRKATAKLVETRREKKE
ncbi:unnamed protein product [Darwinula stevensoni]|uniref:Solute carrier family 66 member 3 n=1 Tax=Darwinula stevensoni TaxID=69355 RepID=A0A7R8XD34_9CRUS|nr:unnamed protein product [Darwinula stevensoni]CAG0893934.1 unnamed protein product [Darwinula stevensoni]